MKLFIYSTVFFLFLFTNTLNAQVVTSEDDYISMSEDTVNVEISVLDNDGGGPAVCTGLLSVSILTNAIHGSGLVSGGQIIYTPNANYHGNDTIIYRVCDCNIGSTNCSVSSVFITVNPTNDAPVAVTDFTTILEEQTVVVNVIANDYDIDGGTLNIISAGIAPINGEAIILGNNNISYTPDPNFFGIDSFPYQLCDNGLGSSASLCDTAWVFITILNLNDNPEFFKNDTTISIVEGDTICFNINQFDSSIDGNFDTLDFSVFSTTNLLNTSINSSTSELCFEGSTLNADTVIITMCDQANLCDTFTTYFNTVLVNDPPVAVNDTLTATEDNLLMIDVLHNDFDPELGNLSITILCPSSYGTEIINNSILEYTPILNYFGLDTLCYELCDDGSPILCDTAFVFINIVNVNDTPALAQNDTSINIEVGEIICFNIDQFDTQVDENLDTLTYHLISTSNPTNTSLDSLSSSLCFEGSSSAFDTVSVTICDQIGLCDTFTTYYNTNLINDVPNAVNDTLTVNEDNLILIDVLINDTDPELDSLTVFIACESTNGTETINNNMVEYIPNLNYYGLDTICYSICDNAIPALCDTAYIFISILPVVDSIIANDDESQVLPGTITIVNVAANDINIDNDSTTINILDFPSNGTATISGNEISYTPTPGFIGYDTLLYQICNTGVTCDAAYLYFFVSENEPIVAVNDSVSIYQFENISFNPIGNDINNNNDSLSYGIVSFPQEGTLIFDENGNLVYEAPADFIGTVEAQYYVCNNSIPYFCDTATIYFTISENVFIPKIPNSFSPNGDMVNDYLVIENIHLFKENKLTIFGRWGNILFEQEDYENNFNASNVQNKIILGKEFSEAVYFYIFKYKTIKGAREKTGYIHIKR